MRLVGRSGRNALTTTRVETRFLPSRPGHAFTNPTPLFSRVLLPVPRGRSDFGILVLTRRLQA